VSEQVAAGGPDDPVGPGEEQEREAGRDRRRARVLDGIEAALWVALLVFGTLVALAILRIDEPRDRSGLRTVVAPSGLIECEDLPVVAKSRDFTFWLQPASGFRGGKWSKDGHMFASGTEKGDWIDLRLPETEPGRHQLELFLTKSLDYGIVTVSLNGVPVGEFDLWTGRGVVPTGPLDLGEVELGGRGDILRFAVSAHNPRAGPPFFQFGIDGIRLGGPDRDSGSPTPSGTP
jgi:hypothetical protein